MILQPGGFLSDALVARNEFDHDEGPLVQQRQAIDRLYRELNELSGLTGKPPRDWLAFRGRLVRLAALVSRAARDLGLETTADAAGKDIPF